MTLKLANLTWAAALTLSPLTLHALAQNQPAPDPGSYSAARGKPFAAAAPTPVPVTTISKTETSTNSTHTTTLAHNDAAPAAHTQTTTETETSTSGASTLTVSQGEGQQQVKDDLFAGTEKFAKGASDVSDVNIGPDTLGMVSGKHGGDLAKKMNFMLVRSYTYPKPGMYNLADVDAYRQKLRTGNWNCFVHTYEHKTGESTDICSRPLPGGEGNEMVIMTVEPSQLTFIHMGGKGSLADLGKLGNLGNLGVPPTPPPPPSPK
jgi:hypothetical protein